MDESQTGCDFLLLFSLRPKELRKSCLDFMTAGKVESKIARSLMRGRNGNCVPHTVTSAELSFEQLVYRMLWTYAVFKMWPIWN